MEWVASADVGMVMGQPPCGVKLLQNIFAKISHDIKTRMARIASDYLVLKRGYDHSWISGLVSTPKPVVFVPNMRIQSLITNQVGRCNLY